MNHLPRPALLMVGVLALAGTTAAQDPVGVWTIGMDFNGTVRESSLSITRGEGGVLAGTWSSELGDAELANVTFEAGTLSFVRTVTFNEQSFEMAFEGTIEGNNLTGAIYTDFGEMGVTGSREASQAQPGGAAALIGTWNGTSATLRGELTWQLVVHEDLTAVVQSEEGSTPVRDIALEGDRLTYVVSVASGDQKYELAFAGTLEGSTFSGRYSLPGLGEIAEVTAARSESPDLTVMVGEWQLTSRSDMGDQQSSLTINEDLSGTISFGEFGSFPLDYVDIVNGDELWFGIAASFQNQQVYIEFAGKLEGNSFSGGLWVGDQEVAQMTGTKK